MRQAGSAPVLSPEQLEESVCSAFISWLGFIVLLRVLVIAAALLAQLALQAAPTLAVSGYLRHSIGLKASPSGSKSLVQPGYLARRALETCAPAALDLVLTAVNNAVQTSDAAVYAATTVEDVLGAVTKASALVAARAAGALPLSAQSPAVSYVQLLLAKPPLPWTTLASDEDSLQAALAAIRSALDALASRNAAPAESAFREQLHTQLQGVAALLDKTPQEDPAPPIDLNEATSFPDPDVAFLMADLVSRNCTSAQTGQLKRPTRSSTDRARSMAFRTGQPRWRGSPRCSSSASRRARRGAALLRAPSRARSSRSSSPPRPSSGRARARA